MAERNNAARHGTRSKYNTGCRCEPCAESNRARAREQYARGYRPPRSNAESVQHGTSFKYKLGCRCAECSEADLARHHKTLYGSIPSRPGACESCNRGERLIADHDHGTGEFRGWICHSCNIGIGRFGDTVEGLERVLRYLRTGSGK